MKPILSIVIPTYGSPGSTKRTVERILEFDIREIEIVVSDNDPTGKQLGDYGNEVLDERLSFYRNTSNIGRSNNIVKTIERAKAGFVLLCGCNDTLYKRGVEAIIEQIAKTPDASIIMGNVITTENNSAFRSVEAGTYNQGFSALNAIPFLGNYLPITLKKECLPLAELYDIDEAYMQHRLMLIAASKGDFVYLDTLIGIIQDNGTDNESTTNAEIKNLNIDYSSWNHDGIYYSPQARAKQLISDLEIIDGYRLRQDKHLLLVDKHVNYKVSDVVEYIYSCRDPYLIQQAEKLTGVAHLEFYSADEALAIFEKLVEPYFASREKENDYYYRGRLHDKIQNELLLVREGELILQRIKQTPIVYVFDQGTKGERLTRILKLMGIECKMLDMSIENEDNNCIVLVADIYDRKLEDEIQSMGMPEVYFMDLMDKYLAVAWCHLNNGGRDYNTFRRIL